jgi:paraquat-inducible protein B
MSEAQAAVSSRRRLPAIWLVPIVALALGLYMVIYTYTTEGPEVTIVFATADGIEAGKTKLKSRSVQIGLVERVTLNEDLKSVSVVAKLEPVARPLLRDDTRFWVVRARLGAGGISGLGTIMSGGYIEVEPGASEPSAKREFRGLENVPVTPVGTPGVKLVLTSSHAGGVGTGNPILYRGYAVGRIERTEFDEPTQTVRHHAFIDAPYDQLLNEASRFWKTSGISLSASASGMRLDVGSLQTLLAGGVSFGLPEHTKAGGRVANGAEFALYDHFEDAQELTFRHGAEYVVAFEQSVRGLEPGAPVTYRGLRVGSVLRVMIEEAGKASRDAYAQPIPVLIRVEPARIGLPDTEEAVARFKEDMASDVGHGLRATLQSTNLLTGRLMVAFDFYFDDPVREIGTFAGHPELPTLPGGLERIERSAARLLSKLNALPLDRTVRELNSTLAQIRLAVGNEQLQELPESLSQSLARLDRTLDSVEGLSRTVGEQPNSLIFSRPIKPDPEPKAP